MPLINWAAIDWVSLVASSLLVLLVAHIGERTVVWQSHARGRGDCNSVRCRVRALVLRS